MSIKKEISFKFFIIPNIDRGDELVLNFKLLATFFQNVRVDKDGFANKNL